jgi:hypothetical protein
VKLIITNDPYTYLKQGSEQSSEIVKRDPMGVFKIPNGAELPIKSFKEVVDSNGIYFVCEMASPILGKTEWYAFGKHCKIQVEAPAQAPTIQVGQGSLTLLDKVILTMQRRGFKVFMGDGEINIVAVRGMRPSGVACENKPNFFDDLLLLFKFVNGCPQLIDLWVCTTEPGSFWTFNPMNPGGAARIDCPGQYSSWQVGYHQGKANHLALVQTGGPVRVRRDRNKDFSQEGDKIDTGYFGVNVHHGWNAAYSNIGRTSAGCVVIPRIDLQKLFMSEIMKDRRYLANSKFVFTITFLNGLEVFNAAPSN